MTTSIIGPSDAQAARNDEQVLPPIALARWESEGGALHNGIIGYPWDHSIPAA